MTRMREIDRRTALQYLLAAGLAGAPPAALLTSCAGNDQRPVAGTGMPGGPMPDWMMSSGEMGNGMAHEMPVIHRLLIAHEEIDRDVQDIPNGIRSVTTSSDSEIAELIRTHVDQMGARMERGDAIRQMDPLFRELFEHSDAITIQITDLPDGVQVTETSSDPQVQLLIWQHAHRAVSEFVASGMQRAMQPTPLPEGYGQ